MRFALVEIERTQRGEFSIGFRVERKVIVQSFR